MTRFIAALIFFPFDTRVINITGHGYIKIFFQDLKNCVTNGIN